MRSQEMRRGLGFLTLIKSAFLRRRKGKESNMTSLVQIVLGFLFGGIGFWQVAENPLQGCIIMLFGGLMLLSGIDCFDRPR